MQAKTARKILCNEAFAEKVAKSQGIVVEAIKREARERLRDVNKRKRQNEKENRA
jgi:hypothetical protein